MEPIPLTEHTKYLGLLAAKEDKGTAWSPPPKTPWMVSGNSSELKMKNEAVFDVYREARAYKERKSVRYTT